MPEQRTRLVKAILGDEGSNTATGARVGSLGKSLHTIPSHHADIINAFNKMTDADKALAIRGLGTGLHHPESPQRDTLANAIKDMPVDHPIDRQNKSYVLPGLLEGFSALSVTQRDDVFQAVLDIRDENESALVDCMEALNQGVNALSLEQLTNLAQKIDQMEGEKAQYQALQHLGPALKNMADSEYIKLLDALSTIALNMTDEFKSLALGLLAKGLHQLGPPGSFTADEHARLIARIMSTIQPRNGSDNGHYLTTEQARSNVITGLGLGLGLGALTAEQKGVVIDISLAMEPDEHRSFAIGELDTALPYLDAEQQETLMTACMGIHDEIYKSQAMAGLGAGLQTLAARLHMTSSNPSTQRDQAYQLLASQRQNAITQLTRLVDAAGQLSSIPIGQSPRAKALSALAPALDAYQKDVLSD